MKRTVQVSVLLILAAVLLTATSCMPWGFDPVWPFFALPLWIISTALYFLPTIIAAVRHARNLLAIFLVNLLTGWTFIGWVIALIWSIVGARNP